jgi:hypothetical protein
VTLVIEWNSNDTCVQQVMKVSISQSTPKEISFAFVMDEVDATVPVPVVWLRHDAVDRIAPDRLALMAYLMAKPFVGNSLELSGVPIPAHLAARMTEDFAAHEFFVGPISNVREMIVPTYQYDALAVRLYGERVMSGDQGAPLLCRTSELGYVIEPVASSEMLPLAISTNVDFFVAFTARPAALAAVLTYLSVFDALGIRRLCMRGSHLDYIWSGRVQRLLSEVGASVSFSPA